jgi:geranylgeranyl pyrophosphate synthase
MAEAEIPMLPAKEIWDVGDGSEQAAVSAVCAHLLASKGKQLRSSVLLASASLGGSAQQSLVRRAGAVIEALHLATLAHDDVIDDSELRRGTATVGARFGCVSAAFGGGWLFTRCVAAMVVCGDTAVEMLAAAVADVCNGEMLELEDLFNVNRTRERYFAAVRGKTAALFALAARVGGELAGIPARQCEALSDYGVQLGIAFQIADDVLDIVSPDSVTGKRRGGDVRHGVYTLPVLHALEENPALRERLARKMSAAELEEVLFLTTRTTGVKQALVECRNHADLAKAALDIFAPSPARSSLHRLADEAIAPAWSDS